ncbi:biotin--[acetyl-CoA-carboxylase] ligase [Moraxella cuniculi]|uniref:Bifunctional protein BirA n=1 Tax=Moraxella cuniculi TaxID=34061 RepID=A0A3S4R4W0_9GAMM|nr:biotin--[acetyl-CoA-carboxylase] ligase [Moraxella cuniculi]VEG12881.1 Bifunctional protein BirA [Moraxella cuniculi]
MADSDFDDLWQQICQNHHHKPLTDSTNTQLIDAVVEGRVDNDKFVLFTADSQSAGRGQHGRSWLSGRGNVFLSLYVPMHTRHARFGLGRLTGLLSLLVGFYLANLPVIEQINHERTKEHLPLIGVKWANDVGFYDDNRQLFQKLAGILIEPVFAKQPVALTGVVIGIGLNVANSPVIADGLYQAASMADIWQSSLGKLPQAHEWYQPICHGIYQAIMHHNRLCDGSQARADFVRQFNRCHVLTNRQIAIYVRDDMTTVHQAGRCLGIDEQGALLIDTTDGVQAVFAGMVQLAK